MSEETILQGILPVAQQENTCLIGTTTPAGTDHIVSTMISAVDKRGNPVIRTVRIGAPCEECRRMQRLCTHSESTAPEGTSRTKREKYPLLYGDRRHVVMREYAGEMGDASRKTFQASWIHRLKISKPVPVPEHIDMLFLTSDPAQGGDCEWATIGAYYDRNLGSMVICLLDSFCLKPATPRDTKIKLQNSIDTIRSAHPAFGAAPIVYCVESAPKMFAEAIAEYADEIARANRINIVCMNENSDGRPGVPKTNGTTSLMVETAQRYLENNAVLFSTHCVTSCPTIAEERKKLLGQLERVSRKVDEKTGKVRIDGKDGGANDDYAVAFMMQPFWHQWFWAKSNPNYEKTKRYSLRFRGASAYSGRDEFKVRSYEIPFDDEQKAVANKRQKRQHEVDQLFFTL